MATFFSPENVSWAKRTQVKGVWQTGAEAGFCRRTGFRRPSLRDEEGQILTALDRMSAPRSDLNSYEKPLHNHFPPDKVNIGMSKSENQFSLTRAAPTTCGRAKGKFLSILCR